MLEDREHVLEITQPLLSVGVVGDITRLTQVVANLLGNAARFTPIRGRISLSLTAEGLDAVLRVRDDGVGIPTDMLARVFELFAQLEGSGDTATGGLGIGLDLVRRLVEMHAAPLPPRAGASDWAASSWFALVCWWV